MKLCTDRLKKVSGAHKPPCIQRFPLQWQTGGQSSCTYFLMGKLRHKIAKSRAKTWLGHLVTCDVTPSPLLTCTGLGDRAASRPQDTDPLGSVQPTAGGTCSSACPTRFLERRVGAAGLRSSQGFGQSFSLPACAYV